MIEFFSKLECTSIIDQKNSYDWKLVNNGYKYLETPINDMFIYTKISERFSEQTGLKIINQYVRLIRFEKGHKLINHGFDYTNYPSSPYRNTKFGVLIFLNNDFIGGEYRFSNELQNIQPGIGFIYKRTDVGKLNRIKDGTLYVIIVHVISTEPIRLF